MKGLLGNLGTAVGSNLSSLRQGVQQQVQQLAQNVAERREEQHSTGGRAAGELLSRVRDGPSFGSPILLKSSPGRLAGSTASARPGDGASPAAVVSLSFVGLAGAVARS
jgi:hypothetical protein